MAAASRAVADAPGELAAAPAGLADAPAELASASPCDCGASLAGGPAGAFPGAAGAGCEDGVADAGDDVAAALLCDEPASPEPVGVPVPGEPSLAELGVAAESTPAEPDASPPAEPDAPDSVLAGDAGSLAGPAVAAAALPASPPCGSEELPSGACGEPAGSLGVAPCPDAPSSPLLAAGTCAPSLAALALASCSLPRTTAALALDPSGSLPVEFVVVESFVIVAPSSVVTVSSRVVVVPSSVVVDSLVVADVVTGWEVELPGSVDDGVEGLCWPLLAGGATDVTGPGGSADETLDGATETVGGAGVSVLGDVSICTTTGALASAFASLLAAEELDVAEDA